MPRGNPSAIVSATRAFAGQSALILLPVILLAVLATATLRSDRREAEQRAKEQGEAGARAVARAVASQWVESLQYYEQARQELFPRSVGAWFPSPLAMLAHGARPSATALPHEVSVTDWMLPDAIFSRDGTLVDPLPYPANPVPPTWWTELDPELRARWEVARHLEHENAPTTNVVAAYERCREVVTNYFFDANVLFALRRLSSLNLPPDQAADFLLSFSIGPHVLSPAGVPVAALVLFEILNREETSPLPAEVMKRLADAVTVFPSILTPALLQLAEVGQTRAPGGDLVSWKTLQNRWQADQRWRALAPEVPESALTNGSAFWIGPVANPLLALPYSFTSIQQEADGRTTNELVAVSVLPIAALRPMARDALEASRGLVPNYATATLRWAGRVLSEEPAATAPELGHFEMPISSSLARPLRLEVTLRLTDSEALYGDQRRRERRTALLILAAVVAAGCGVWQAWRTLQRQLALNEQKSNFVSAVSHELRAPLASVRLLAEGLADGQVHGDAKRSEYAGFLVEETRRLGALVENVLNYARIEEGRTEYEFAPTDVRRLVRETIDRFESVAAARQLRIRMIDRTVEPTLEPRWDGVAVQQALSNVLDNALKHGPEASEVIVSLALTPRQPPMLQLSVSDSGPGIPAEDHARIFERFYRRGSELRRETRGVGLGLALVKHIVEAHRGRVVVVSEVGRGATFTLELPLEPEIPKT